MSAIRVESDLYQAAREHLQGRVEQVGFFLAEFDPSRRAFQLREWRPMPSEAFEIQSSFHVTLGEEARPELIKWAWDAGLSLVEVHSHREEYGAAAFSPSDMFGFDEWIPHLWWRLQGRPYAAIVCAGDSFDALAWVDASNQPEQIATLEVAGEGVYSATGQTLEVPELGRNDDDGR